MKYNNDWIALEGVITDSRYLKEIQLMFEGVAKAETLYAYVISKKNINKLENEWSGVSTCIQKDAITKELGIFNTPDGLYNKYKQKFSAIKKILYTFFAKKYMNKKLRKIRKLSNLAN